MQFKLFLLLMKKNSLNKLYCILNVIFCSICNTWQPNPKEDSEFEAPKKRKTTLSEMKRNETLKPGFLSQYFHTDAYRWEFVYFLKKII